MFKKVKEFIMSEAGDTLLSFSGETCVIILLMYVFRHSVTEAVITTLIWLNVIYYCKLGRLNTRINELEKIK